MRFGIVGLLPKDPREISKKDGKIKAEDGLIKGVWIANYPGILRITFDNSYSMLRPKTINYSIKFKYSFNQNCSKE